MDLMTDTGAGEAATKAANDPAGGLPRVRELLERGEVEGARSLVRELQAAWPESAEVAALAALLALPRAIVRPGGPRRRLDLERAWLRAHAREHRGCWLAVRESELLGADPDLNVVMDKANQIVGSDDFTLFFQP